MLLMNGKIVKQYETTGEGGTPSVKFGDVFDDNAGFPKPGDEAERLAAEKTASEAAAAKATADATAIQTQEIAETETLLGKETLTETEKARLEVLKTKYNVEEVKDDGTPLSEDEKKAAKVIEDRLKLINGKPELQRTLEEINFLKENTPAPKKSLFEQVDELRGGEPIEIDYKGVDPMSPEGVLIREEVLMEVAQETYDAELKEKFPDVYAMYRHRLAGGSMQDFLQANTEDYQSITLVKSDLATQESVYRKALASKGISAEQVEILVTAAKDKGKLFDVANTELIALQKNQVEAEKQREVVIAKQKAEKTKTIDGFLTTLTATIAKGIKGQAIPQAEQKPFAQFIANSIFYDNGRLVQQKVIEVGKLEDELSAAYFAFKKGDISKLVAAKAQDQRAQQVRGAIKVKITPKGSTLPAVKQVPLSQL